ncbi:Lsr2 family protein [Nonomuraea typhae]|uniref:Lsr2 family protein n=1 Tax=Nonomuraea typhae TaxID=2603600 RepID=A0ABW7YJI5_9ACTN
MVKRQEEVLVDDVDGSPADETINFTINGDEYEIDLSGPNAARFRATWAPWLSKARKVVRRRRRSMVSARGSGVVTDPKKVRGWAREVGLPVNEKGYPQVSVELEYLRAWVKGDVPRKFS